jgi:hypothetical protein
MDIHNFVFNTYFPIVMTSKQKTKEEIDTCYKQLDKIIGEYDLTNSYHGSYLVLAIIMSYDKLIVIDEEKNNFSKAILFHYANWHFKYQTTSYMTTINQITTIIRECIINNDKNIESKLHHILFNYTNRINTTNNTYHVRYINNLIRIFAGCMSLFSLYYFFNMYKNELAHVINESANVIINMYNTQFSFSYYFNFQSVMTYDPFVSLSVGISTIKEYVTSNWEYIGNLLHSFIDRNEDIIIMMN